MSNLTNTGAAHEPSGVETNPNSVLNGAYIATLPFPVSLSTGVLTPGWCRESGNAMLPLMVRVMPRWPASTSPGGGGGGLQGHDRLQGCQA